MYFYFFRLFLSSSAAGEEEKEETQPTKKILSAGLVKTLLFRFHQGRDVQQDTADYSVSCELSLRGTHLTGKESSPFHG